MAAILMTGCGSVEGLDVPVQDAFFVEDAGLGDGAIVVFVSSLATACDRMATMLQSLDSGATSDELAERWAQTYPEEFWEVQIVLRVADPADSLAGETLDGAAGADSVQRDQGFAIIDHYEGSPTAEYWTTGDDDVVETSFSEGGAITISEHSPGVSLSGEFETEVVDESGADIGPLSIQWNSVRCDPVEALWF